MAYVYHDFRRDDVLAMIPDDGQVIGSIGCGAGVLEGELVARGRTVHGVDISPEAIAAAASRLTTARVIDPADRRFFDPASLDGLILADVIEHVPSAWEALADFAGFVRPGGWVVISVPNMHNWKALWQFVVRGDWPEDEVGIFDRTHLQVMTTRRLDRWCDAAELDVERRFDRYLVQYHPRQTKLVAAFDKLTFRLLHNFTQFQIQVRCRRRAGSGGPASAREGEPS